MGQIGLDVYALAVKRWKYTKGKKKKAGNQFGFEWPLEARKGRRAAQKPPTHPNRRHQMPRNTKR